MTEDIFDKVSKYIDEMSDEDFEKLVKECEEEFCVSKYGYILNDEPPYLVGYERGDYMETLDLTELSDGYTLDSFTVKDIREYAMESIKLHKNLKGELIRRLETGRPFKDAPTGVSNRKAYDFLFGKLLKAAHMFEDSQMKLKLKKEKWEYIRENEMPWTDEDYVNVDEIDTQIEYCRYNAQLTRQRIEILEIIKKENCI